MSGSDEALATLAQQARYRRDEAWRQPAWREQDGGLALRLPPRPPVAAHTGANAPRDRATLKLSLPAQAAIHLPTAWNVGTLIDREMSVGETFHAGLSYFGTRWMTYPLVLVNLGSGWLEVAARSPLEAIGPDQGGGGLLEHITPRRPSATVTRTPAGFTLAFEWPAEDELTLRTWPSMEAAVDNHHAWLRATYGLRSIRERVASGDLPVWVESVPVVFTFDLWRPHGEVAHTYTHLRDFARDLKALGVPPGALFYLPGWCAPYDLGYPHYVPAPELGGPAAFGEALAALHDAGYRAMVHTLAWGADPYRPEFARLAHLAVRAQPHHSPNRRCGPYVGWPGGAPERTLAWQSDREPIAALRPSARGWTFETAPVPEPCEAILTLGGLVGIGEGVVRATVNGRSLTTPAGWFVREVSEGRDETYRFPFRLRFQAGVNQVALEVFGGPGNIGGPGGPPPDVRRAWYQIGEAVQFTGAWTAPIAGMDADSPEWHAAYLERLAPTIEAFGIDAVHIDASMLWRWDEDGFFAAVRRRLPRTVFGSEAVTAASMGFFTFGQGGHLFERRTAGTWTGKPSDLPWRITGQYMRLYQHLCAPRGFVPVGAACNVRPVPAALPEGDLERWRTQLARSPQAHVLYNLRVNYRDYGLDEGTRAFLQEHVARPG